MVRDSIDDSRCLREISAEESFKPDASLTPLHEESLFEDDDDLPTPEEANSEVDFTENK